MVLRVDYFVQRDFQCDRLRPANSGELRSGELGDVAPTMFNFADPRFIHLFVYFVTSCGTRHNRRQLFDLLQSQ